ncbi:MAG: WD40 repeat domain-containing protein, partial [Promethearchaeota archaeon]
MAREDLLQKVIGASMFALPLLFVSTFAMGLEAITDEWHTEFLLALSIISAVFGFLVIRKIVKHVTDLLLGTIVFVAAYINLVILVLDGLMGVYDPIAYPLFLILIGFMLTYPLFEWRALADPTQRDAMLPLQVKGEHFLERLITLAGGRRPVVAGFYVLVYGPAASILYWLFEDLILVALLAALFVPLINLGYLTGRGLGDDLLWWKEFRTKEKENENQSHWLVIDWDRKRLGAFQKITLGTKSVIILGLILLLYSLYGLYTDVLTLTTGFLVSATVGLTLVVKTLVLSGRNAVNETRKLFDATRVKDDPSRFSLFYPIYIGVAIFLAVAVEFLVNVPGSVEQLSMGLGIQQHRVLLSALLLVEELVMVVTAGMVLIREEQPIVVRDVSEDEFRVLAPVEQHLALEKWHRDAQTLPLPEQRLEALKRAIRYAQDLLRTRIILPFLTSSYDAIRSYAREEFKRLLVGNRRVGDYCLTLLERGSLLLDTREAVANIMAFEPYMDSLRKLAQRGKINANWLVTVLEGHDVPVRAVFADEKYLYSGGRDGIIRVWDRKSWELVSVLEGHTVQIHSLTSDSRHTYSGSGDGLVRVWDKENLSLVETLDHGVGVWRVFVDDKYLYSNTEERLVHVWDRATLTPVTTLRWPGGVVGVWSDDKYIFTGSNAGVVLVWNKTTFDLRKRLEGHDTEALVFADDTHLYSASKYEARVWDRETLAPLGTLKDDDIGGIWADERNLYTSRSSWFTGGPIQVWDKETLTQSKTLEGHTGVVNSLFADDTYIYSASEDNTVRVWDRETMPLVAPPGHSRRISSVWSDDQYLY